MLRGARSAGTTLVELLVVIVIFLVGILAVVQIFPKGFQILLLSRNASVATSLSRDEAERLKARPDQLPEAIVSAYSDGTLDIARSTRDLGPAGNGLLQSGILTLNGTPRGNWGRFTGANNARHVVGETQRVPAPRQVGLFTQAAYFGGLMVLQFNPVDSATPTGIKAYGNDFLVRQADWNPADDRGDYETFFVRAADGESIRLPQGLTARRYRISFSAYVTNAGVTGRRNFLGLTVDVPAGLAIGTPQGPRFPLYPPIEDAPLTLSSILRTPANNINGRYDSVVLGEVEPSTLRIQRQYEQIPSNFPWSNDPYEFKILNGPLGVLLFNPAAHTTFVPRGGVREPLLARVDYDVYDWRVLRDEFRFSPGLPAEHRLPVGSLVVGKSTGVDGITAGPIAPFETATDDSDNLILMDLDTGGIYQELRDQRPFDRLITVNKSSGLIVFSDSDGNRANGITARLRLPDGTVRGDIGVEGRAIRALYRVRNEMAVQVVKAPSLLSQVNGNPGYGEFSVGTGRGYLIYFAPSVAGANITVGELDLRIVNRTTGADAGFPPVRLFGVNLDARARPNEPGASIDVSGLVPNLDANNVAVVDYNIDGNSPANPVRDVKSASITVRTVWNPQFFTLGPDSDLNMRALERWGQGWRRSSNETFLEQGDLF